MRRTPAVALGLFLVTGLAACGSPTPGPSGTVTATQTTTDSPTSPDDPTRSPTFGATGGPGENFQALGTEPFWSVAVTGDQLLFTQPDQADQTLTGTRSEDDAGDEVKITGTHEGVQFRLEVDREQCSDGMSDTQYDWKAEFHYGDTELRGCARPAS